MKIILNHWGKKPFGCWWLNCSYNSLLIYYHPRYCFKYLKIRLKVILTLFFNAKSVSSYHQNKKKIHNNKETKQNKKKTTKEKILKKKNPKEKPHRILLMHIIVYTLSALGFSHLWSSFVVLTHARWVCISTICNKIIWIVY